MHICYLYYLRTQTRSHFKVKTSDQILLQTTSCAWQDMVLIHSADYLAQISYRHQPHISTNIHITNRVLQTDTIWVVCVQSSSYKLFAA